MPQRSGAANVTTDHEFIRRWVEERGGCPATVKRTKSGGGAGLLRIDYPGFSGKESLEAISWDEFFDKFEENDLAFLYQEATSGGKQSRFSKLVSRETAAAKNGAAGRARTARTGTRSTTRGSQRTQGRAQARSTASGGRTGSRKKAAPSKKAKPQSAATSRSRTAARSGTTKKTTPSPTPRRGRQTQRRRASK